jgi:hypothetical protein
MLFNIVCLTVALTRLIVPRLELFIFGVTRDEYGLNFYDKLVGSRLGSPICQYAMFLFGSNIAWPIRQTAMVSYRISVDYKFVIGGSHD